jgi:hypothetical protein
MKNNELKKGDVVWLDGYTSMAQQNSQEEFEIEEVKYQFDEASGEKFPIYLVSENWYDGRRWELFFK